MTGICYASASFSNQGSGLTLKLSLTNIIIKPKNPFMALSPFDFYPFTYGGWVSTGF